MTLKSNALITVDELLVSMGKNRDDLSCDFFRIYNSASDATAATISIAANVLTLIVTGGTSAHSTTFDLTNALYDTITELIAAIQALNKNWVINRLTSGSELTINLQSIPITSALLVANEQTLIGFNGEYVDNIINTSSQFIENYCNRKFVSQTFTEYYDGNNENKLLLTNFPVTVFTSLQLWDYQNQIVQETYVVHSDYEVYLEEGIIYKAGYFLYGHKNYKTIYVAGYTASTMPDDIKTAVFELSKLAYYKTDKQGIESETIGRYSVSYGSNSNATYFMGVAVPAYILSLLAPYRRLDLRGLS